MSGRYHVAGDNATGESGITVQALGRLNKQGADLFVPTIAKGMANAKKTEAQTTNYGAVITAIRVLDRNLRI